MLQMQSYMILLKYAPIILIFCSFVTWMLKMKFDNNGYGGVLVNKKRILPK